MTLTEELRKVYSEESLKSWTGRVEDMHGSALLAVARYVAERQRAVEPTYAMIKAAQDKRSPGTIYRAMSAVAPLVVE